MASKLALGFLLGLTFAFIADAHTDLVPKVFNVMKYGAIADAKTDNSKAFLRAWMDACQWKGRNRVLIPRGIYMVHSVRFMGPCNGEMTFRIRGMLKAPTNPYLFFTDTWIAFQYVNELTVKGGGYLDGQGSYAWPYNDCSTNHYCKPLPVSMRFDFITNSRIRNLRSINSKSTHVNLFSCKNINISHVRITAPEDSPNTDGIRIGKSEDIKISRTNIGTGDDCISMVSGSKNVHISEVACGPGHGISIGSLGKGFEGESVTGINVWNSTFHNTQNGVRIKTWSPSLSGVVSGIAFYKLIMDNVNNPIIIDQDYCPFPNCDSKSKSDSRIQIKDVTFRNIWGISSSRVAIYMLCSGLVPCQKIRLVDINLVYKGPGGPAISWCSNVIGNSYGKQLPPGCL